MQKVTAYSNTTPKLVEQIAAAIARGNASARETAAANQLLALVPRLARGKGDLLTADGVNGELAASLSKDISSARSITEGFLIGSDRLGNSNPALQADLAKLQDALSQYQQAIGSVIGNQQNILAAKKALQQIQSLNEQMKDRLNDMKNVYFEDLQVLYWPFWAMLFCDSGDAGVARQLHDRADPGRYHRSARSPKKRRQDAEQQRQEAIRLEEEARELNERNQAAILRLMNELQEVGGRRLDDSGNCFGRYHRRDR